MFATSSGHLLHTRFNDYHFLARSSLANVDLRVVCELADRFSLAMPTDGDGLVRHLIQWTRFLKSSAVFFFLLKALEALH